SASRKSSSFTPAFWPGRGASAKSVVEAASLRAERTLALEGRLRGRPESVKETSTMARMFGFIGNRADLGARVLAHSASILRVARQPGEPLGWGVGFYQAGEVLLRRRPIDDREMIDLGEVTDGVRTDVLVGHVRRFINEQLRTENTH